MLNWFEKTAPIRVKFKAILAFNLAVAILTLVTMRSEGAGFQILATAMAAYFVMTLFLMIAAQRICTPYVSTVLRMEALAAGNTDLPIHYTDHKDCVGRMTKAMAVFRDNAVSLRDSSAAQETQVVGSLGGALKKLSQNQLDCQLTEAFSGAYDELRQDFNAAVSSLGSAIRSVRTSAASVKDGAAEIRSASNDLAQRNERQAANLEETASTMNQVTDNIRQTAERATAIQRTVTSTYEEAVAGGKVVAEATSAMGAIERSAREIESIVGVIDAIAFQTNLLALNAGVEAARAGESGRGFAVVATEVRALAQRSAEAAKDIKALINTSTQEVGTGVTLVAETGSLLENILGRVGEISGAMHEIAENASAQSAHLQQINMTVGAMDKMTQQNAAMVEQSTAASRSLADEAQELTDLVSQFSVGEAARPIRLAA